MKRITYFLLIFSLIGLTCKKPIEGEEEKLAVCDNNPNELQWIKDLKAGIGECKPYGGATLTMFTSEKETLFLFDNFSSSLGICGYVLYNCSGKRVSPTFFSSEDRRLFLTTHTTGIVIWQKN